MVLVVPVVLAVPVVPVALAVPVVPVVPEALPAWAVLPRRLLPSLKMAK